MAQGTFEIECQDAVARLKSAIIELLDAGEANPHKPQDISRKFGINKTLTWSLSRFLECEGPMEAVAYVPGAGTLARVAAAFPSTPRLIEAKARLKDAATGFDAMIARHADDRATLDLILDNVGREDPLELSRRLTFRGNSGLCGVQARTRLGAWFLAPNRDDPTMLDMADLRGYVRVRRLRPNVEWPIFKLRAWSGAHDPIERQTWEAVDPAAGSGVPLLREFCKGELPAIDETPTPEGKDYTVRSGPIGNAGAFDCFTAERMRRVAPRFRTTADTTGEVGTTISTPCESLIIDLIFHKDMREVMTAESLVFSEIIPHGMPTPGRDDRRVLPLRPRLIPLAGHPPAVATPMVPRYSEMQQVMFGAMGWEAREFTGLRLELQHPPLHSHVVVRFDLPER